MRIPKLGLPSLFLPRRRPSLVFPLFARRRSPAKLINTRDIDGVSLNDSSANPLFFMCGIYFSCYREQQANVNYSPAIRKVGNSDMFILYAILFNATFDSEDIDD